LIDLHIHTTYSDGTYSVKEILKEAQEKKLEVISITDHDNVKAYKEIGKIDVNNFYSGKIITGCEFKCVLPEYNLPIEILGYEFEVSIVEKFLDSHNNMEKQSKYLEHLKSVGKRIGLTFDENIKVNLERAEYASLIFEREINKYEKNKQILLENGINITTNFYRDAQSNKNSIFYIDEKNDYVQPDEIIDLIHKAGGKSFLAHPYIYRVNNVLEMAQTLINNYNIDGLECYYSLFTQQQTNDLVELCKKNKLYRSGGTDFHGDNKTNIQLGNGIGNLNVRIENVQEWLTK